MNEHNEQVQRKRISICAITLLMLAFLAPDDAESNTLTAEYFVGDKVLGICLNRICVIESDVLTVNDLNIVTSLYRNKAYSTVEDCSKGLSYYQNKISPSSFFPLSSSKTGFGGIFTVNKVNYHAKMNCDNNFMIAKITKI